MTSKNIIIILIAIIIVIAGAIAATVILPNMSVNKEPQMKTIETKAFKFNTTIDDNWTFYKDHDDGYSYKNDEINQSKIRYYTGSIDEIFEPINALSWKQLNESNLRDNIYLYESHFDSEVPVESSYHNYYSAFFKLKDGGYVHVSSMDLNRTVTIANAINEANN